MEVPPETIMFNLFFTHKLRKSATSLEIDPVLIRSSVLINFFELSDSYYNTAICCNRRDNNIYS